MVSQVGCGPLLKYLDNSDSTDFEAGWGAVAVSGNAFTHYTQTAVNLIEDPSVVPTHCLQGSLDPLVMLDRRD